jgi:hypothetical protein
MKISLHMPQAHNPQNPVSLRFMWLRHEHQIIPNTMEKIKISCIKVAFLQDFPSVYTVKDAVG